VSGNLPAFESSGAKDWVRKRVDLPIVRDFAQRVRGQTNPVGYLGTPGPQLLDLREWRPYIDYALASEYRPTDLSALRFNARKYFPEGFVRSTEVRIEEILARGPSGWEDVFGEENRVPSLINYDVYANPVLPSWEAFRPDDGFWRGMRGYLHAVRDELSSLLLSLTFNVRGSGRQYDLALDDMFMVVRDYGVEIPQEAENQFKTRGMPKKCQICIPYWLSRFAATVESYIVDIIDSLDYAGTKRRRMVHLDLGLRRIEEPARASEITFLRLLNFPHRTVIEAASGDFSALVPEYPVISPRRTSETFGPG